MEAFRAVNETGMERKGDARDAKVLKRRRVSVACQKCRQLKAKCDGKRPKCERCIAYGYNCVWTDSNSVPHETDNWLNQSDEISSLSRLLHSSAIESPLDLLRPLAQIVKPQLTVTDRRKLEDACQLVGNRTLHDEIRPVQAERSTDTITTAQAYLGEASEGHFISSISQNLGDSPDESVSARAIDCSYVEGEAILTLDNISILPEISPTEGVRYVQMFTSNIGVAYPFVPIAQLENAAYQWTRNPQSNELSVYWRSIVLAVFAISAYYEALSSDEPSGESAGNKPKHWHLFQQSFNLTSRYDHRRDLERVWARLCHCFYLLATTQIDRCWTHLGQVVRTAHSIGLHTENIGAANHTQGDVDGEQRRTTWFCLFVLDHLLSLQLGRPPAIYTPFFSVRVPTDVMACLGDNSHFIIASTPVAEAEEPVRKYLIAMFDLSTMIEEIMQTLYAPQDNITADRHIVAMRLDQKLLDWRANLDRQLRFDLGHAFEESPIHKRHRNFLAIKFFHLRSLIHRPAMSFLERDAPTFRARLSANALSVDMTNSITTCIESAQNTARLLYDIRNKEDVIQNFPWWQMISCLTCASSILLVTAVDPRLSALVDIQAVDEDANICLKVFKALSVNSRAAEAALNVMDKLRATKMSMMDESSMARLNKHGKAVPVDALLHTTRPPSETSTSANGSRRDTHITEESSTYLPGIPAGFEASADSFNFDLFEMDGVMFDPLNWSAQFINDSLIPGLDMQPPAEA